MPTIDAVQNGDTGLESRNKLNMALQSVELRPDLTLIGDGSDASPLGINTQTGIVYILKASPTIDTVGDRRITVVSNETFLQRYDGVSWVEELLLPSDAPIQNRVVINSLSDFPDPVAGVISLAANREYYIGDIVDIGANRFSLAPNISFTGAPGSSQIDSSNTGSLFTGGDLGIFTLRGMFFDCPDAQLLDISDTVPGLTTINLVNSRAIRLRKLGTVNDTLGFVSGLFSALDIDDGLSLQGNNTVISIQESSMFSTSNTFTGVDFGTSISPTIEISNLLCSAPTGAVGISGAALSANLPVGALADVVSCEFLGGMDSLAVLTSNDIRWCFRGNSNIPDTYPDALLSFQGNSLTTVISASSTDGSNAVLVNAVWDFEQAKFVCDTAGRATWAGERPISVPVDARLTVSPATANDIAIYIAVNGVPIPATGLPSSVRSNDTLTISTTWQLVMAPGDFLEVFLENQTGSQNIVGINGVFRLR